MSEENVEAVKRAHEHFDRTGELLREICHPDAEWMAAREDPDAQTHRGLDAIQAYFSRWTEMFTETEFTSDEVIEAPNDCVFAWVGFTGRGATSGVPVNMQLAQVWTFRGGKAARVEEYFDRADALEAAGLSE